MNNHEEEKKVDKEEQEKLLEKMTKLSQFSTKLKTERDELKRKVKEDNALGTDAKLRKELKKCEKRKDGLIKEV